MKPRLALTGGSTRGCPVAKKFSPSESLAIEKMASRRRMVSIALVAAIVGGGFLYGYEGTIRRLPLLQVTVSVQGSVPEGLFLTGEFGQHCGFNFINSWGEVETRTPIPLNAAAAVFVFVELLLPASSIGDEPVLIFMTGPTMEFLSRPHPQLGLFTLELQGGEFLVPPGTVLGPGDSSRYSTTYVWSDEEVSFEVTEMFTFESLGLMRVRQPLPPGQLCF